MGWGQAMFPYSLVKKEGFIHWQESLFNQWRNACYSALFVSSSLWPRSVFTWRKNNQVRARVNMLGATTPPSCVFFLLLQKIPHVPPSCEVPPPSCSNLWLDSLYHLRSFLSHHVSLTRCQYRCPSQTIALGSFYHYVVHTQWLLCSRSSTGPKSECWKPSVYASAALSLWCPLCQCPPTGTSRCPVYRRFLVNGWKETTKLEKVL